MTVWLGDGCQKYVKGGTGGAQILPKGNTGVVKLGRRSEEEEGSSAPEVANIRRGKLLGK